MGYAVHIIRTGHLFRDRVKSEYLKMYPLNNQYKMWIDDKSPNFGL